MPFVVKTSPSTIESHDGSAADRSMGNKHFVKGLGKYCIITIFIFCFDPILLRGIYYKGHGIVIDATWVGAR